MIKSLLLSTLYSAIKAYLGSGVYNRLAEEVQAQMQYTELSGAEKMGRVLAFAQREAFTASEYLIRAAIELILYRTKSEG